MPDEKRKRPLCKLTAAQHRYHLQLYALPKFHMSQVPLCPIVSSIGSATYHLAKELTRILTPPRGKTDSYVKLSAHFVEKIKEIIPQDLDVIVSFDVRSLFTRVSIDEAMRVVREKLAEGTTMTSHTICHLTELCMKSTYFIFEDEHDQIEGAPMGSPLSSPVLADLYMECFEMVAIKCTNNTRRCGSDMWMTLLSFGPMGMIL